MKRWTNRIARYFALVTLMFVASGQALANPDKFLFEAISKSDLKAVKQFVSKGADINRLDKKLGYTPLILAIRNGEEEIANFLLDEGAEVKTLGYNRYTALHHAASYSSPKIIKLLVKNGADLEARAAGGRTPLISAVRDGSAENLKQLIELGASVRVILDDGTSSLHHLSEDAVHGSLDRAIEKADFLVQNGAPPRWKEHRRGRTPAEWILARAKFYDASSSKMEKLETQLISIFD